MPTDLFYEIKLFQKNSNNFMDILPYFNSKINYLSYKLKYPEAHTDLVIYLYELILKLDLYKLNDSEVILKYVKKCLENKSINLSYKINFYKNNFIFNSNAEILDLMDKDNFSDEYSNIIFNDLISLFKPKQKQILFYKFYLQLSDIEIAKILKISRQAVNKTERVCLKMLKTKLCREVKYD